jgi:hypothetical protein
MPIDKSKVQRLIDAMDTYLKQLEQDRLNGYPDDDDENGDTDPRQFGDPSRYAPVAEPPDLLMDSKSAMVRPRKDLFR